MTLPAVQKALVAGILDWHARKGILVPVIAEDDGNVQTMRDAELARTHLAVTVGAASFRPRSSASANVVGTAQVVVTVWERPTRNRIGQPETGHGRTATEEAEGLACAINLLRFGGGVFVLAGIGGVERRDESAVVRTVTFETMTTLTGD